MAFWKIFVRDEWQKEKSARHKKAKELLASAEGGDAEKKKAAMERVDELVRQTKLIVVAYRRLGDQGMENVARWSRIREDQDEDSYIRTIWDYLFLSKGLSRKYSKNLATRLSVEICDMRYGIKPADKAEMCVETVNGLWSRLSEPQIEETFGVARMRPTNGKNEYFPTALELTELQERYYKETPGLAIEHLRRKYKMMQMSATPLDDKIAENLLGKDKTE